MSGTVRNLRVVPRPYDHEVDEDAINVQCSPLVWSLIHQACRTSSSTAMREAGEIVAAQVRAVQAARIQADLADATYEYRDGA